MTRRTSEPPVPTAIEDGRTASETHDPSGPPESGEVRSALEVTLAELTRMGRIETIDAAKVAQLRAQADQLDGKSRGNSQMHREFREGLEALTADGDDASELGELISLLRPDVRDPSPA